MFRNLIVLLLLTAVLMIASCGGGMQPDPDRTTSGKGIISVKAATGSPRAGAPSIIYFYDDGSSSSNGPIVKFEWNFGDGWEDWTSTDGLASHTYDVPGIMNAHLRVTDSTGKRASDKVKVIIEQGFDADVVHMLWGVDESDADDLGADGKSLRYHEWRWRSLAYDPEIPSYTENHVLSIAIGDPDFDLLRVYSEGSRKDFVLGDLDGDGLDDDSSVSRVYVLPHILEIRGRCIGRGKEDVYVWKIKAIGANGEGKKEYTGHVTLMK